MQSVQWYREKVDPPPPQLVEDEQHWGTVKQKGGGIIKYISAYRETCSAVSPAVWQTCWGEAETDDVTSLLWRCVAFRLLSSIVVWVSGRPDGPTNQTTLTEQFRTRNLSFFFWADKNNLKEKSKNRNDKSWRVYSRHTLPACHTCVAPPTMSVGFWLVVLPVKKKNQKKINNQSKSGTRPAPGSLTSTQLCLLKANLKKKKN